MVAEEETVLLNAFDFPEGYVNMQHPEDYEPQESPVVPSYIVNWRANHMRLIFRISWKSGSTYVPMTFIVDTGAGNGIYLSQRAKAVLDAHRLLLRDELQTPVVRLGGELLVRYCDTPTAYEPANLIGLGFLTRFGLTVGAGAFAFGRAFAHF